jgi:hypothetical protein
MGWSRTLAISLAVLSTVALATPSQAAVNFGREASFQADGLVSSVATADLNADGNVDILAPYAFTPGIAPGPATTGILIVLGDGHGSGSARNQALGTALKSVVTGDFNGDGKQDVVGTFDDGNTSAGVETLLGDGGGGLTESASQAAGAHPASIVSADFNKDGKLDVAVVNSGTSNVSVLLGTGTGAFASPATSTLTRAPSSLVAADVNGDAKIDLVATTTGGVAFLYGDGAGAFASNDGVAISGGTDGVAVGDVNADGVADIATVTTAKNSASVLLGGAGGFTVMPLAVAGPAPRQVVISDMDLDGCPDLGIFGYESGTGKFGVYLGDGRGSFTGYATFAPGRVGGLIADFNRDGAPDVVVGVGHPATSRASTDTVGVDFNLPVLMAADLRFGVETIGFPAKPRALTLTNTGAAPLRVSAASITGIAAADYSVVNDACTGQTIPHQQTCVLKVGFVPHRLGGRDAFVAVAANTAEGSHTFALTGNGTRIPGVGIRHRTLKIDGHGYIRLRVSCPALQRCKGLLTIRSTRTLVLKTPGTPRHVAVAKGRFRLRSGQRTTFRIRANKTARRLIRQLGRLRVTVRVSEQGRFVEHVAFGTALRRRR